MSLRTCSFPSLDGALPSTTHHQLLTGEGVNSGACGILEQSTQQA